MKKIPVIPAVSTHALALAAMRTLARTPERHKRERIYEALVSLDKQSVDNLRKKFNDLDGNRSTSDPT